VPGKDHDVLFVGTGTSLMAYDVERNADVFYKDVPDGVSSITFGWVRGIAEPLVIVGGHCSIQVRRQEGTHTYI
jgi:Bardet-Biedl syndrome 2 protein